MDVSDIARVAVDPQVVMPLRRSGPQRPLFCLHPASGFAVRYLGLLPYLTPGMPVYGIQARGLMAPAPLPASLDEMAADYAAQIVAVQPAGPYRLLGWCFGGRLAFEVACRLQESGRVVDQLALIDAYPPAESPELDHVGMLLSLLLPPGTRTVDPELVEICRQPGFDRLNGYLKRTGHTMRHLSEVAFAAAFRIYQNSDRLGRTPIDRRFDGAPECFTAADMGADADLDPLAWRAFVTGEPAVHRIDCARSDLMEAGPLSRICASLTGR
jgi:thioesterase domain-containing protein